ncbi:MAG: hypothetical protein HN712_11835 [Gemmatimonadetes bacterium]|jgi:hypothetical protein|nr:hypothetical protein [Gemmatimonadota bacterium]MBT7860999.1 hypothetical protein [Gemmatimonadota bacterium]
MTTQTATGIQEVITSIDATTLYHEADRVSQLWKGDDDGSIRIFRGEVIESDSPGAGRSDHPEIEPFFQLEGELEVRKVLRLDRADAISTQLGFVAIEDNDSQSTLRLLINGVEVLRPPSSQVAPEARQYRELSWSRWYYVPIPAGVLREGENEIRMSAVDGGSGWQLMVADYRDFSKGMEDPVVLPHDSDRSIDGGDTWEAERGEYVVRLLLDRYLPQGELIASVLDAAGEQDQPVRSERTLETLQVSWAENQPDGTALSISMRSGAHPAPTGSAAPSEDDNWSDWQTCVSGADLPVLRGRYVQARIQWSTTDRCASPALESLTLQAKVGIGTDRLPRVAGFRNARIRPSSEPMPHEDPRCRLLQQLRRECELDAVVAGAQTQFEVIQRLHRWAYHIPLGDCTHFPWNVLDWIDLQRGEDCSIELNSYSARRRDKMCLYPNVVLVAALQSFGMPARHLNFHSEGMTGHEICEVWSNDHEKWIHLDATRDYYWFDRRTLTPLDTEEIHRVLVDRLETIETWQSPYLYRQDLDALVADLPITYWDGEYEHSVDDGDHGALFLFRSFSHFRIVPRFDVFSRPRPLPVSQGTEIWAWDGYLNWAEDRVPPLPHFSHHTNRRADFYPTLNQTRFTAVSIEDGRQLKMSMESSTPDFAAYEVRIGDGPWQEMTQEWNWPLRDGMNTAQMRSRNRSGVTGVASALSVVA